MNTLYNIFELPFSCTILPAVDTTKWKTQETSWEENNYETYYETKLALINAVNI